MTAPPGPVAVMGAGSVGCYVGGLLQAAGAQVHFIARPRVQSALTRHGLTITDLQGGHVTLQPAQLHLFSQPEEPAPLALLCVKSGATAQAAAELARCMPPGTPVISLQNGVANAEVAAKAAPGLIWLPGMVPFNVAELGPGRYHRGTVGALSGLPLRAQLLDRDSRVVLAALQDEALAALAAAGIAPARLIPVPPRWLPTVLRLRTPLFKGMAARMLRIDEKARSSMADDLARGSQTEVDAICGAVVRLAQQQGLRAPLSERLVALLSQQRPAVIGPQALRQTLGL